MRGNKAPKISKQIRVTHTVLMVLVGIPSMSGEVKKLLSADKGVHAAGVTRMTARRPAAKEGWSRCIAVAAQSAKIYCARWTLNPNADARIRQSMASCFDVSKPARQVARLEQETLAKSKDHGIPNCHKLPADDGCIAIDRP